MSRPQPFNNDSLQLQKRCWIDLLKAKESPPVVFGFANRMMLQAEKQGD